MVKLQMLVRQATSHDLPQILSLYKDGLNELGQNDWRESLLVKKVTESFVVAPCFVVVIDGNIVGIAGLTLGITSHNGVATLCDYMFYVQPEHRNINVLGGLMEEIKRFANANHLPVKLEFICHNDEKLRARLFKRYGFKPYAVIGSYEG